MNDKHNRITAKLSHVRKWTREIKDMKQTVRDNRRNGMIGPW